MKPTFYSFVVALTCAGSLGFTACSDDASPSSKGSGGSAGRPSGGATGDGGSGLTSSGGAPGSGGLGGTPSMGGQAGDGGVGAEGGAGGDSGAAGGSSEFACDSTKYNFETYRTSAGTTIAKVYADACQGCHGVYRQGNLGPNLLPSGQIGSQTDQAVYASVKYGRPGTSMDTRFFPDLAAKDDDICALVAFLRSPADVANLNWTTAEINASMRIMYPGKECGGLKDDGTQDAACTVTLAEVEATLPAVTTATHDLENLMLVTERESRKIAVLDASATDPADNKQGKFIGEIAASYRAHGYTFDPAQNVSDGSIVPNRKRWVYNVGRDGFLYKMDLVTLKSLARVRVGIDSRAIAVSDDGKYVIVGNYIPFSAVVVDTTTMKVTQYLDTSSSNTVSGVNSRVAGINATQRWIDYSESTGAYTGQGGGGYFLMLLKDAGEAWRIDYTGTAGSFAVEKLADVGAILHEAFNSSDQKTFFATAQGAGHMAVIDVASWTLKVKIGGGNKPHPGAGAFWTFDVDGSGTIGADETFAATIHIGDSKLLVWNVDKAAAGVEESFMVATGGPGLFVFTMEKATGIWADQTFSTTNTAAFMKFPKDPNLLKDAANRADITIAGATKLVHPEVDNTGKWVYVSDWGGHMVYVLPENPETPYAGQSTVMPYKTFKNIPDPTGIFNTHRRYSPLGH